MTEPQVPIPAPVAQFEPNVVLAGIEGAVVAWVGYGAISGRSLNLPPLGEWQWSYSVYVVVAGVGLVLVGLAIEGLAGLTEFAVARHVFGKKRGTLRPWYIKAAQPPNDWRDGQRWMWKSPQAAQEFARRRLRILVCRNTAVLLLALTLLVLIALVHRKPPFWGWLMLADVAAGAVLVTLFGWLWVNAHQGWNHAVRDASILGSP